MSMSRSEAAQLLGVPENADAKTVNAAYRKCIAKYHPDANRNKSPQEQQVATEMFKKCGVAKKVMLAPPERPKPAQAQGQASGGRPSDAAYNDNTGARTAQPRRQSAPQAQYQTPRTSNGNAQQVRQQAQNASSGNGFYNRATTFVDNIPKVVDDAERQIHNFYQKETRKKYSTPADLFRVTPSMLVSLVYIVLAIVSMFLAPAATPAPAAPDETFTLMPFAITPLMVFIGAMVLKLVVYDGIISYYVNKLFSKMKLNWFVQCGVEALLTALAFLCVMTGSAPVDIAVVGGGIACGIACIAAGIAKKVISSKKKGD